MSTALKRVNLMLDEELIRRLKREAHRRRVSVSELVRTLLARDLGAGEQGNATLERIRGLRARLGPVPDSTGVIRAARDNGW